MSERKPSKIDKVKSAEKLAKAKWVVHRTVAVSSVVVFAADGPQYPKWPRNFGD